MTNTIWIARDKDGDLYLYSEKPKADDNGVFYGEADQNRIFITTSAPWVEIDSDLYPEVTFENSPKELIIKD